MHPTQDSVHWTEGSVLLTQGSVLLTQGRGARVRALFDRGSLLGIAAGMALIMQPWWAGGFRAGFFIVLGATLVQIVAAHVAVGERG